MEFRLIYKGSLHAQSAGSGGTRVRAEAWEMTGRVRVQSSLQAPIFLDSQSLCSIIVLWLARRFLLAFEHPTTPSSTRKTPYFLSFHMLTHTWFHHFPHLLSFQSFPHTSPQNTGGITFAPLPEAPFNLLISASSAFSARDSPCFFLHSASQTGQSGTDCTT